MKLLNKNVALNQSGMVKIIPEEPDDLWDIYNLITIGDVITTMTNRKIKRDDNLFNIVDDTDASDPDNLRRTKKPERITLVIRIKVTHHDYEKDSSTICVQGKNMDEAEYIKASSMHSFNIELNKPFELYKKIWTSESISKLSQPSNNFLPVDLVVFLIQEKTAEVYLVGNGVTKLCTKIKASKTKKKSARCMLFQDLFKVFMKHVDFQQIRSVLIASVGSTKDKFRTFLIDEAKRLGMKKMEDNKRRIVVGEREKKWGLKEVLNNDRVIDLIKETSVAMEIRAFRQLWDFLDSDSGRACYGSKNVEEAHEMAAIDTLLITDYLYRSSDIETRNKYMNLAKSVMDGGGKVLVDSSINISPQQLSSLTGIAAILWFPLPFLDEQIMGL